MRAVERMRKLLNNLPKSDQTLGEQFLQCRDFESLKDLVDSAIYMVRKHRARRDEAGETPPKQEYLEVDLAELNNLKAEVDLYLTQLEIPSNEEGYDPIIEEDYYDEKY